MNKMLTEQALELFSQELLFFSNDGNIFGCSETLLCVDCVLLDNNKYCYVANNKFELFALAKEKYPELFL